MNLVELELDETLADFEVQDWIDNVFSVQYPDVKARIKKGCIGLCHKKDEWHYVKDELPPRRNNTSGDSNDVFVATKGYGNYEGHYVFAEETWFNINGEIIPAVYAWIELPVPPKESE